jgi:predicted TIM-barrel fold metal-dependent hydrolase
VIFDSLTHVTSDGRWFGTTLDASEAELLRQMDESGVQHAVVVALAGHIDNRFVLDVCQRHPDRLVPCASLNPVAYASSVEARAAISQELKNTPYRALKLHPRLNRYDPLGEPRCLALLEELASTPNPLPVWLDTLFYYQGGAMLKPTVDTIHELVGRFPSLTFVLLHGGGSWILQVAEAIRDCPNAFLDISFTMTRYKLGSIREDLRYLVGAFDRRLIFGSDFPEVSIRGALNTFTEVTRGTPPDKCANVLSRNLSRILDMERK